MSPSTLAIGVSASIGTIAEARNAFIFLYPHVRRLMNGRCTREALPQISDDPHWFCMPPEFEQPIVEKDVWKIPTPVDMALSELQKENVALIASYCTGAVGMLTELYRGTQACVLRWGCKRATLDCNALLHGPGSYCCLFWQMRALVHAYWALMSPASQKKAIEQCLEKYFKLNMDYVEKHEHQAQLSLRKNIKPIEQSLHERAQQKKIVYFSEMIDFARWWAPTDEAYYQMWLAVRLASSMQCTVEGDRSDLVKSYAKLIGGPVVDCTLVMDEIFPLELGSYVLPYMLLSRDGSLYMETSEGYVVKVVEHLIIGAMGEYKYVEATRPEHFVRVRHLISSSINLVENLTWSSILGLLRVLKGERGDWHDALYRMVGAEDILQRETAAVEVLEKLADMSAESNWRKCVIGGVNVGRLIRWSNETGNVEKLRHRMLHQMITILSCHSFRIEIPSSRGSILVVLGGPRSLWKRSGNLIQMAGSDKFSELSTTLQLQTALSGSFPESSKWEFWFSVLAGEISAYQATYARRTTSLDRISQRHMAADMVLTLESELRFDVDRGQDIIEFLSAEADDEANDKVD